MARRKRALTAEAAKDMREEREEEPRDSNYKGRSVLTHYTSGKHSNFAKTSPHLPELLTFSHCSVGS
jgi:hypothetical protein